MSNALMSGVTGLTAHQKMLDVAGNNLANINTYGFKASRVTFAELLAQTMKEATQPSDTQGGTNPLQIGAGATVASIDRNMSPGTLMNTGQPLDMAIDGAGYFVLNDGEKDVYTRVGSFAVDARNYLVDPATGHRVQRTGTEGVDEGFQVSGSSDILIPYNSALPARATETVTFVGNLSADADSPTTNLLTSGIQYTTGGMVASATTPLADLDQANGIASGETIRITGKKPNDDNVDVTFTIGDGVGQDGLTVGALIQKIHNAFDGDLPTGAAATLVNGEIRLTDNTAGYSLSDLGLTYSGAGTFQLPSFFKVLTAGGGETRNTNVEVLDSLGVKHVLSVAFVRTDTPNMWDMVLTNLTGPNVVIDDRRVCGITFNSDGSYGGLDSTIGDTATVTVRFSGASGPATSLNMALGAVGQFDGLCQFGGASTVAVSRQDGYEAGYLSSLSVSREGVLVGMFTNGARCNIAALKLATFLNPAGLTSMGGGYFVASANSGDPLETRGLVGGAGAVVGGSLERSNVDVAQEFVNLIHAQNGFQANARTIRVTNDMLRELANLIR